MQIWQLFIVLKQPVDISVTASSNPTKFTDYIKICKNMLKKDVNQH